MFSAGPVCFLTVSNTEEQQHSSLFLGDLGVEQRPKEGMGCPRGQEEDAVTYTGSGTEHGVKVGISAHVLSDMPRVRMKSKCIPPHIPGTQHISIPRNYNKGASEGILPLGDTELKTETTEINKTQSMSSGDSVEEAGDYLVVLLGTGDYGPHKGSENYSLGLMKTVTRGAHEFS
ncbi:hypothetical protein H920_15062 [Fukomys damarensis]|uniref:Uncharacterized protein n=1 Tax=Fukomys damarensis TaxID=885580 RepID=A0A091CZZ3_FUKDA|nr:hypothetical protein H920_15062 [Fukomys damarensis]